VTRKELAATVARVIQQHRLDGFTPLELAFAILDKAEPLIRRAERADLRAKVEALPTVGSTVQPTTYLRRADVLALFDGAPR
jgi:hypothetical protein